MSPPRGVRPLHVLILGDWLPFPHGMAITSRARLVARALHQAGVSVRVLTLQAADRPWRVENTQVRGTYHDIPYEYACGTTVRHDSFVARRMIAAWGWINGTRRLLELRRQGRLDVVHLWFWTPRPAFRLAFYLAVLRLLRVPVVGEVDEKTWSMDPEAGALARAWSPLAGMAGAVTISEELRDWAEGQSRRTRRRIVELPILVDVDEQQPTPLPGDPPLVVFAGGSGYRETIRFIFTAMEVVWRTHPDCRLAVTGVAVADPWASWLIEEVGRPELADRVDLVGYLERGELLALYERAHALLIPLFDDQRSKSRFPTKIGEYLAAARPVVTNGVGEVARYFTDGEDAVVCPPGDPAAFGRGIAHLLSDPARAARIAAAGRRIAEERFHYAAHGEELARAFSEIAARGAAR